MCKKYIKYQIYFQAQEFLFKYISGNYCCKILLKFESVLDILGKYPQRFREFGTFASKLQRERLFFAALPKHRVPSNGTFNIRNEELYLLLSLHSFIANLFVRPLFFFAECARTYLEFSFLLFRGLVLCFSSLSLSLLLFLSLLFLFFYLSIQPFCFGIDSPRDLVASTIIKLIPIKRTDDR